MKKVFAVILIFAFIFSYAPQGFCDQDAGEEIQLLKEQVQRLMQRIEKLETDQAQSNAEVVKVKENAAKVKEAEVSRVCLANTLSKLKMKGRFAAGYFASGKAGSYPSGSFEVPETKLQFSFQPDDLNTIFMRFNLNNAVSTAISSTSPLIDRLYLESKDFLPFLKDTPYSLNGRLGRFSLGFGEEYNSNNSVEGILPSNSAGNVSVVDEGLELNGKIKIEKFGLKPLGWVLSVSDGNREVGSDTSAGKAFLGKLYYTPITPLYLSASYYNSGNLKGSTEISVAGLTGIPSGGGDWKRKTWEIDARYDFGKDKKPLDPPAYSDSKSILRLSYGEFNDSANRGRSGNFGFMDGIYNLTKKIYTAGRFSFVDLNGTGTATLNNVTANKYLRYSLGGGYRWSENTILKLGYDLNKNSGPSIDDADDNLISVIVASQF